MIIPKLEILPKVSTSELWSQDLTIYIYNNGQLQGESYLADPNNNQAVSMNLVGD